MSDALPVVPAPSLRAGDPIDGLRRPALIRARCAAITRAVADGLSGHFVLDRSRLAEVADRVAALTRSRFPDLRVPLHSRWRHFEAGGIDRRAELEARGADRSPVERARIAFDLTVVSVLLDAGAGSAWRYTESAGPLDALALPASRHASADLFALLDRVAPGPAAGAGPAAASERRAAPGAATYTRSEGLAVASLRAFLAGAFSSAPDDPLRVDGAALRQVDVAALRAIFQVSSSNPLVGLEGRAGLLARLGTALQEEALVAGGEARPALLFDRLTAGGTRRSVSATDLLVEVLRLLAPVWRSGGTVLGLPAGDVWPHRWAGADVAERTAGEGGGRDRTTSGVVPFHKLSQWLCYSLVEPLQAAGVEVSGLDELTGLPEYRNGGLLLDGGVIVPRDGRLLAQLWKPADEFVVEWRALTVTLLDELAPLVRERLGRSEAELPLAAILEGGTWAAGRQIAQELRGGAPPLRIDSDGTVF